MEIFRPLLYTHLPQPQRSIKIKAMAISISHQNVVVLRHGDRIDNFEPLWVSTAARPWDPPLIHDGIVRSFKTGQRIRSRIGFPIHRIFVSPFLRCIQTANEVAVALSAVDFDPNAVTSNDVVSIEQSKIKVAVEFGLCEMLNTIAIRPKFVPKDENFDFKISNLESMFLDGITVDQDVNRVYKEMPKWKESPQDCRNRYINVVNTLANMYPSENLLLVTHGEGISSTYSTFSKDQTVYKLEYCACVELRRQISSEVGEFEVIATHGLAGNRYQRSST